jgi:hypothetical protein
MATTNTCKKCGCEDSFMPSPAPCPTPAGCPTPQPCSEVFDAQCVVYTGADIECDNDTVVTSNTIVSEALKDVVDYFCNKPVVACPALYVDIEKVPLSLNLIANVQNGTAPYTYEWTFEDGAPNIQFTTATTNQTVGYNNIPGGGYLLENQTIQATKFTSLVKVKVTDVNGCIATAYYMPAIISTRQ